ncbi:PBP1A family penicillin-binding protein [Phenylobacterium sp. NIBR 498073]|uniref:multimodular transpeptidase-transglycosylase PbpC n=1 Tax=Phenylobacterium sp. NIBR 498073 TaxID=3015177 RepID=UPI0022B58734|nr:PBP1A family penicillin-binding protein [Phenylobacterium sp. NIBR 498073]WGU41458.1 PBP1A family penicillin-binding protein [Phenylobacterium sp. NIBR 498073]
MTDDNNDSHGAKSPFGQRREPPEADLTGSPAKGKRGRRSRLWAVLKWTGVAMLLLLAAGLVAAGMAWNHVNKTYLQDLPQVPTRQELYASTRAPAIKFYDMNGQFIASRGPQYGENVRLASLPDYVPKAFLAAEDRRFYQHGAVDPWAIARAARANQKAGRVVEGGSTITQQLAKGMFLSPDQNLKRKIQEAALAYKLEQMLSKDEVLELYLDRIYFGANTFGLDGASRTYFGKPATQLNLSEAALLASLPKAPSRMALHRNMDKALQRQRLVLERMRGENWISDAEMRAALAAPPRLAATALANEGDNGYLIDYAQAEVLRMVGQNSPDLNVTLTVDPRLQSAGAQVLRRIIEVDGKASGASQGAMIALDSTGAIRTMVGGVDYTKSVFNRAVQAKRQPGSSFKPFIYAAALEKGVLPTDTRVDEPVKIGGWEPKNYGGKYAGAVTVESALARSLNTVAVKLGEEVGPAAIANLAGRFGITTLPPTPNLSVSLGAYEVPLIEMTSAYQVFQQAGSRLRPYIVAQIQTTDGQVIYTHQTSSPVPAYDIHWASMMVKMMQKVVTAGTGTRANFGRPAAGKTGTSQNFRDAWFIGFTPDYVAGVWVGNDDDRPMNQVTGGQVAAAIWKDYMVTAHMNLPSREFEWLLPDPEPVYEDDPRNGFYEGLAYDFETTEHDAAPPPEPFSQPPVPDVVEPDAEPAPN